MLLLPGLEGSGELYAGLVEQLGPEFDAKIVKYPHSCRSYVHARAVVREQLPGSRPFIIVAESFSTPLAVQIAAEAQDEIDGLVLCNGFVSNPLSGFESMWASAAAPWFFQFPLTSIAARMFLLGADAADGLVAEVQHAVGPAPPDVLCARLRAVLGCDARDALRRLRIPLLCLQSTRDRLVGESPQREMLCIKPDLAVERIDGPHLLLQREPQRCARIITRFAGRIVSQPSAVGDRAAIRSRFPRRRQKPTPTGN
ncbi:MAG TPA: alpha/beta fold hydrolase [Terracidiphilus sp.]|nr:alpha/beta fold hydrolase [Terracidiphilus sp.]